VLHYALMPRDVCVVGTGPLSAMLVGFVDDWNRSRPSTGGRFLGGSQRESAVEPFGAIEWLSQETGVPAKTIQNIARTPPRSRVTSLGVADALVAALGHPEAWHDGTLEVTPATKAARASGCCGGSDPGGYTTDSLTGVG
jgi:hypothetical protein